jgi:hypothetical protein
VGGLCPEKEGVPVSETTETVVVVDANDDGMVEVIAP